MKLIILSGMSGAGKDTVINELRDKYNLEKYRTHTTRKIRVNESDKDYFFVSDEEFKQFEYNNQLWQRAEFGGNKYGSTKEYIDNVVNSNKNHYVILTPEGVVAFKKEFKKRGVTEKNILMLYLEVKDRKILKSRIKQRGDSDEALNKRIKEMEPELEAARKLPYKFIDSSESPEKTKKLVEREFKNFLNKEVNLTK